MFHVFQLTDTNTGAMSYQTTSGLVLGFGIGLTAAISDKLLFSAELSYQLGYQGTSVQGMGVTRGRRLLTFGFGLLLPLR